LPTALRKQTGTKGTEPKRTVHQQEGALLSKPRRCLERDEIDGLIDDETIGQLAGIRYEIDGRGRIKIEPKEHARARGVSSLDRAEALMLALGEAPRLYEFTSIREFERPKLRDQAARDAFEDQMNDYRRLGLRSSRGWPPKGYAY
jgi:hypothetical protein